MKELGLTKVGVLARGDEYGKSGSDDIINRIKEQGLEVIGVESYQPGDTDFTGQITKLIDKGIDAVVLYATGEDLGPQMKQLRQYGYNGYVFGPEGFTLPEVREVAGSAADGAVFAAAYLIPDSVDEAINDLEKKFLQTYVDKFGELPASDNAYRGYDAVYLLAEAIKNAGSLEGPKIRDALENITDYAGLAGTFNFKGNNGEGINDIRTFTIKDGKIVLLENK